MCASAVLRQDVAFFDQSSGSAGDLTSSINEDTVSAYIYRRVWSVLQIEHRLDVKVITALDILHQIRLRIFWSIFLELIMTHQAKSTLQHIQASQNAFHGSTRQL